MDAMTHKPTADLMIIGAFCGVVLLSSEHEAFTCEPMPTG